jgi:RimJ/RimL family protein N-acetyltransferase
LSQRTQKHQRDHRANVEAKLPMLERAFALGFRRVEFKTDARNERSRRALEALPAQFEGVLRRCSFAEGSGATPPTTAS